MRLVLGAAAIGLAVTLLGTPVAIRLFRTWGWGQRIREDGPHTHMEKMGTPTMGGIVILVALVVGYVVTRLVFGGFTPAGWSLLVRGAWGSARSGSSTTSSRCTAAARSDCRCRRSSSGTALVSLLFALLVVHFASSTGTSTELSFIRETGIKLGIVFYLWAFIVLTASSHAVNLTDGLDGLASGSSIFVLSAYVFIAFWQFRHALRARAAPRPATTGRPGGDARRRRRGGGDDGRGRRVPVVERRAGADLHGRHRLAGARRAVRRARHHARTPSCCSSSWAGCS